MVSKLIVIVGACALLSGCGQLLVPHNLRVVIDSIERDLCSDCGEYVAMNEGGK